MINEQKTEGAGLRLSPNGGDNRHKNRGSIACENATTEVMQDHQDRNVAGKSAIKATTFRVRT